MITDVDCDDCIDVDKLLQSNPIPIAYFYPSHSHAAATTTGTTEGLEGADPSEAKAKMEEVPTRAPKQKLRRASDLGKEILERAHKLLALATAVKLNYVGSPGDRRNESICTRC